MTASVGFLSVLVSVAMGGAALAVLILLGFWIRDAIRGELW